MNGRAHWTSSGGLVGFRATPASQPPAWISPSVRWRWVTTSGWTAMLATPASAKEGIRLSGLVICRWASMGRSMAAASEAATIGPTVRLGTKWLSITSKWTRLAPPPCARRTSSARFAKSAASIEGAPTTLSPSSPKYVNSVPSSSADPANSILQNGHYPVSYRRNPLNGQLLAIHGEQDVPLARRVHQCKSGLLLQ